MDTIIDILILLKYIVTLTVVVMLFLAYKRISIIEKTMNKIMEDVEQIKAKQDES